MTSIMGIRYVLCFNSRWLGGWLVSDVYNGHKVCFML